MPKTRATRKKATAKAQHQKPGEDGQRRERIQDPIGLPGAIDASDEQPELIRLSADDENPAGNVVDAWRQLINQDGGSLYEDIPRIACADDDLALHVQAEMRAKICRHEYINVALLLQKDAISRDEPPVSLIK